MKKKAITLILTLILCVVIIFTVIADSVSESIFHCLFPVEETLPETLDDEQLKAELEAKQKPEKELKQLNEKYSHLKDTAKELFIQGETLKATYTKPTKVRNRERLVYTTTTNDVLNYDALTGQLLCLERTHLYDTVHNSTVLSISEEEALKIANEFINQHCDLSKYSLIGIKHHDITGYSIEYCYLMYDYQTVEGITVDVTDFGEITFFFCNPFIFDNVEIKPLDEEILLKQLDKLVKETNNSFTSYEIEWQRLTVDEDNDLAMEYEVYIKSNMTYENEKKDVQTLGVVYQIKV